MISFELSLVQGFYPRDVVSAVYATATWMGGWLDVCPSQASDV